MEVQETEDIVSDVRQGFQQEVQKGDSCFDNDSTDTRTDILDGMYSGKWPLSPKAFILPIFSIFNHKGMQLRRGCRRLGRNLHDGNAGRQVNNFATLCK